MRKLQPWERVLKRGLPKPVAGLVRGSKGGRHTLAESNTILTEDIQKYCIRDDGSKLAKFFVEKEILKMESGCYRCVAGDFVTEQIQKCTDPQI